MPVSSAPPTAFQPMVTPNAMHANPDDTQTTPTPAGSSYAPDTNTALTPPTLGSVVTRIETMLESIVDSLAACQELSIPLSRRGPRRNVRGSPNDQIHFPGRTVQEARKFTRVLLILQLSHDALVSGTILTKRHIFYQHQDLFDKQSQVDDLVDDIALTLGVDRADLNIVAASKGVLAGPLTIHLKDGSQLDPTSGELGTPIPTTKSISSINVSTLRWILVVEKDAIFRSLCSSQFWRTSYCGPGAILTAKGYPDLITRSFLNMVHTTNPQLPILGLLDFDPDGINIFRCYRYGSLKLSHESTARIPAIRWLGIKSDQLLVTHEVEQEEQVQNHWPSQHNQTPMSQYTTTRTSMSSTTCRDPTSYLSLRDRQAAESALRALRHRSEDCGANELMRELQVMLMLGVKAEIEWLDEAGNLCQWLDHELTFALS